MEVTYIIPFILIGGAILSTCLWIGWMAEKERIEYFDEPIFGHFVVIWLACGLTILGLHYGSKKEQKEIEQLKLHIASHQEITFYQNGPKDFFQIDSVSADTAVVFSGNKFFRIEDIRIIK